MGVARKFRENEKRKMMYVEQFKIFYPEMEHNVNYKDNVVSTNFLTMTVDGSRLLWLLKLPFRIHLSLKSKSIIPDVFWVISNHCRDLMCVTITA